MSDPADRLSALERHADFQDFVADLIESLIAEAAATGAEEVAPACLAVIRTHRVHVLQARARIAAFREPGR